MRAELLLLRQRWQNPALVRVRVPLLFGLLALSAVAGCSGEVKVRTQTDPLADLRAYRTYRWMSRDPAAIDNPRRSLLDEQVKLEVDGRLAMDGYQKTGVESPDFLVGYQWVIGRAAADTLGDFIGYRSAGGTKSLVEAYAIGYEEGVLTLEFMDTKTRRVIWEASAKALVGRNDQPEKLDEVIGAMLKTLKQDDEE